jgi:hypothetical protein
MELELIRTYYPEGTNGFLRLAQDDKRGIICYSIELPWKNNEHRISCIPEGKYGLAKRYSPRLGHHLQVMNVPGRDYILIHPANDALKELEGCIAPVSILEGAGRGFRSRIAVEMIIAIVYPLLDRNEPIFLTIKSELK